MYWFLLLVSLLGIGYIYWSHGNKARRPKGVGFKVMHSAKEPPLKKVSSVLPQTLDFEGEAPKTQEAKLSKTELLQKAIKELEKENEAEAERLLIKVVEIDAKNLEANEKLGVIYLKRGLASKAEPFFKMLTELQVDNVSHLSNLGYSLFMQNRLNDAKRAYRAALAIDSSRPGRFASLAQVHMALEEFSEAVPLLVQALQIAPGSIDFLFLLADSHKRLEEKEKALEALSKILEIDPEHAEAKAWLVEIDTKGGV